MTDLERLFRLLVNAVAERDAALLHRPIPLADVMRAWVPYRSHRALLGTDTVEDYEMLVLRLCAGEGGFVTTEPPEVRERLQREARSTNPDLRALREVGRATLAFNSEPLAYALGPGEEAGFEPPDTVDDADLGIAVMPKQTLAFPVVELDESAIEGDAAETARPAPKAPSLPVFELEPASPSPRNTVVGSGEIPRDPPLATGAGRCPYCGGLLPKGRAVNFCPQCGESLTTMRCAECQGEVELGWKFCITCGSGLDAL